MDKPEKETKSYRFGYDPLDINPALRIEANERVTALQFKSLDARFDRLEDAVARLEKRLWLAVYGVVATILINGIASLSAMSPFTP